MTAQEAINQSIGQNEIARCENTDKNISTLLAECDDWTEGNDELEFWANDPDDESKMAWRVHVRKEAV